MSLSNPRKPIPTFGTLIRQEVQDARKRQELIDDLFQDEFYQTRFRIFDDNKKLFIKNKQDQTLSEEARALIWKMKTADEALLKTEIITHLLWDLYYRTYSDNIKHYFEEHIDHANKDTYIEIYNYAIKHVPRWMKRNMPAQLKLNKVYE